MKTLILLLTTSLLIGCSQNETTLINVFVSNHPKPIIVRKSDAKYQDGSHDLTLQSKDGEILFIPITTITLNDTIK